MSMFSIPCLNPVIFSPPCATPSAVFPGQQGPSYSPNIQKPQPGSEPTRAFCPRPEERVLARALITSALNVYRILGPGFPLACYRIALFRELRLTQVPLVTGVPCHTRMGNQRISLGRLDFVLGGILAVQLHEPGTPLSALKLALFKRMSLSRCSFGVLLNFQAPDFRQVVQRLVN